MFETALKAALIVVGVSLFGSHAVAQQEGAGPAVSAFELAVTDIKSNMMTQPLAAYEKALEAEKLAADAAAPEALAISLWLQAEAQNRLNQPEQALETIARARAAYQGGDAKLEADIYLAQGRIARVLSDYGTSLESFQTAYNLFEELDIPRSKALALQGIRTLYQSARQEERVIEYNQRAAEAFSDGGMLDLVSLNNRANAYRDLGAYDKAADMLSQALQMAEGSGSDLLQVRILENIALLEIERGQFDAAQAAIDRGFEHSKSDDAAGWVPYLWGAEARLQYEMGQYPAARTAVENAFHEVDLMTTSAPYRDFHEVAYKIYDALGVTDKALEHLRQFKRLDDEGRNIAASANMALLNAQFETQNKELEISRLRTAELEKDNAIREVRLQKRRVLVIGTFCVTVLLLGLFAYMFISVRRRNKIVQGFNDALELKNAELHTINIDLEEANQVKTEFLATTSHEIRTPLNAIIGMSDVILKVSDIDEQDKEYIELIHSSGKNLLAIVNDILDVSKLESGKIEPVLAPTDVASCVDDVSSIWRPTVEKKDLTFDVDIDANMPLFETDERLLRQILSNLISNATKFTDSGKISIQAQATDDGFVVEVSDTGVGIELEKQEIIFEAFRQADQSLRRNFEGTGLGLAITKRLAECLGGSVQLKSAAGEGSTFRVEIKSTPVNDVGDVAQPTVKEPEAEVCGNPLESMNVLVAEDNPLNATVIKAYIGKRCRSMTIVENGALAVEAVKDGDFDIILMDKRMPIMSGTEATAAIRQLPGEKSKLPIIAVTADIYEGAAADAMACGMDGYCSKPLDAEELFKAIHVALQGRPQQSTAPQGQVCAAQ